MPIFLTSGNFMITVPPLSIVPFFEIIYNGRQGGINLSNAPSLMCQSNNEDSGELNSDLILIFFNKNKNKDYVNKFKGYKSKDHYILLNRLYNDTYNIISFTMF